MKRCEQCGTENSDDAQFCELCHRSFETQVGGETGQEPPAEETTMSPEAPPSDAFAQHIYVSLPVESPQPQPAGVERKQGISFTVAVVLLVVAIVCGGLLYVFWPKLLGPRGYVSGSTALTFKYPRGWEKLSEEDASLLEEYWRPVMEFYHSANEGIFTDEVGKDALYLMWVSSADMESVGSEDLISSESSLEELTASVTAQLSGGAGSVQAHELQVGGEDALQWSVDFPGMIYMGITVIHGDYSYTISFISSDHKKDSLATFNDIKESIVFKD